MPDVSFSVGSRRYTLRCASGQEDHLLQLAADLDARVQPLAAQVRSKDDRQALVMAAIALLDELAVAGRATEVPDAADESEALRQENAALQQELASLSEENRALREWADGMASRLAALSGTLATLAEEPSAD